MTIKAVLFDMEGTLVRFEVVHPGEVFQRILISLGISIVRRYRERVRARRERRNG